LGRSGCNGKRRRAAAGHGRRIEAALAFTGKARAGRRRKTDRAVVASLPGNRKRQRSRATGARANRGSAPRKSKIGLHGDCNRRRSRNAVVLISAILRRDAVLPDRKSTRLNSSHVAISYAVFCLKKKK